MPPLFQSGAEALLRSTKERGRIEREPSLDGGEYWYRVRFQKRVENIVEGDLEPVGAVGDSLDAIVLSGRWGRLAAFRVAIAIERITRASQNTVYSFKAQRVLFQPFQYKPLLKFLDSRDGRLLIADEVGIGKTIEAGLILAELEARKRRLDRVLIVCPSRLREKWRDELSRKFDRDFDILDRKNIDEYIEQVIRNPRRTALHGIVSMQTIRNEDLRERLLASVDSFDLLIVDEAHHARNPAAQISRMLHDLCRQADAAILLTATPLHLGNRDLFTLLQALRPKEFEQFETFDESLRRFRTIHEAAALTRSMDAAQLPRVATIVSELFLPSRDPIAMQLLSDLEDHPPTERRAWIEIERRVNDLHPLASIVTRTRKRDVEEHAPVRKPHVRKCRFSPEEEFLYKQVVLNTAKVDWTNRPIGLGMVQRARQAASCLPAAVEASTATAKLDDDAAEVTDFDPGELRFAKVDAEPARAVKFTAVDSKFAAFLDRLNEIHAAEPRAKVLVFTFFLGTSRYLTEQLNRRGIAALRIAGDVISDPKNPDRDERGRVMKQFQNDPAIRVLISTEVGSEGLDFQFCHHLVNYDLPWNPMVVEQRIGRIDRFGQKSPVLYIDNMVVEGTVEDRILNALYERIGVFERGIGPMEAILGETMRALQQDYIDGRLSQDEAERRVDQAAWAIENRRAALEELERNAADLFGHEEYLKGQLRQVEHLGRFIGEEMLRAVLDNYLARWHPSARIWEDPVGSRVYHLKMTDELRTAIQKQSRGENLWIDPSRNRVLSFCFDGETAYANGALELINAAHPFVTAAVDGIAETMKDVAARAGRGTIFVDADEGFAAGDYLLVVFQNRIQGIRARALLETACVRLDSGELLAAERGERLMHLALDGGAEADATRAPPTIDSAIWQRILSEARRRNKLLRESEARENDALYVRRKLSLEAERLRDRTNKEAQRAAMVEKGQTRVLPMIDGKLQKVDARFHERMAELDATRQSSCTLSDPLAACLLTVFFKEPSERNAR